MELYTKNRLADEIGADEKDDSGESVIESSLVGRGGERVQGSKDPTHC